MAQLGGGVCCCWGLALLWAAAGRAGEASGGAEAGPERAAGGGPAAAGEKGGRQRGCPQPRGCRATGRGCPAGGARLGTRRSARPAPGDPPRSAPRLGQLRLLRGWLRRERPPVPPWRRVRGGEGPRPPAVSRRLNPSPPPPPAPAGPRRAGSGLAASGACPEIT